MLPPEERHSSFDWIKGQDEIVPGHSGLSDDRYLHLLLEKSIENPNRSEKTLVLSKSEPVPPALNKYGFLEAYR